MNKRITKSLGILKSYQITTKYKTHCDFLYLVVPSFIQRSNISLISLKLTVKLYIEDKNNPLSYY